jgi:hypothetical protein
MNATENLSVIKRIAAERLTRLGDRLRNAMGDQTHVPYRLTRADVEIIEISAQILTGPGQCTDKIAQREAVKAACKDAWTKGKLDLVAVMHSVPITSLLRFVNGDDAALTESQIEWLAVDLRK